VLTLVGFGSVSWATFQSDSFNKWSREHGFVFFTSVNLENQVVSTIEKPQSYVAVNWKHARAYGIHAAGARIVGSQLREGNFESGDFRGSVLASGGPRWEDRVSLFYTNPFQADFREAVFRGVDFFACCYDGLNLQGGIPRCGIIERPLSRMYPQLDTRYVGRARAPGTAGTRYNEFLRRAACASEDQELCSL
jgi:uncharacterized protein YjbI with pentapeptide repeats